MDAIFVDKYGNRKNFLYQHDKGQTLVVENVTYQTAPKIQYAISAIPNTITVQSSVVDGTLTASIPDAFLYAGEDITAYIYLEDDTTGQTIDAVYISVRERKRPSNFVFAMEAFPLVCGTQAESTCAWGGTSEEINGLVDGLTIRYWLPYDSVGPASLNLALTNNGFTGAINCYSYGSTVLDATVPAGTLMLLTYRENVSLNGSEETYTGWWVTSGTGAGGGNELAVDEDGILYLSSGLEEVM